ncbi:lipopolysaccharide biosynthesis protein [Neorhodopirellula lusitana]|uniref:lipopolysaccharide biosynthesis protein n=1 Tax=Neorhodopirellula lusitana TaxID=445327 RepID=UPI003850F094
MARNPTNAAPTTQLNAGSAIASGLTQQTGERVKEQSALVGSLKACDDDLRPESEDERPACSGAETDGLSVGSESFDAGAMELDPARPGDGEATKGATGRIGSFIQTVGFAFGIVALQMGQGILLARLLGPEGRGQYATTVLYVQLLLYIGLFGGLEVICRYAAEGKSDILRLRRSAMWLGITTGVITTVFVIGCNLVALPTEKRFLMPLGLLCALSMIGQHIMLIMTAVDRGSGNYAAYNIRRLVAAAAFPGLLLVAALVTKVTLTLACILFVVASLISAMTCMVGVSNPFRGERNPRVRRLLSESRPYGVSMLATEVFERLDLLLAMWLIPLVAQGFYAAMVPVVYPLTVIPNTLGIFLFNAGADERKGLTTRDVHRILGGSIAIQTVSTIAFMLMIGPLVRLVYGEEFAPAVEFALWLAPVSAIRGILQGLDSYVKGRGRPLAVVRCRIVAAVVMLVVTAMLVQSEGAIAIAKAALVSQIVCLIWLSAIVYRAVSQSKNSSG